MIIGHCIDRPSIWHLDLQTNVTALFQKCMFTKQHVFQGKVKIIQFFKKRILSPFYVNVAARTEFVYVAFSFLFFLVLQVLCLTESWT